MERSPPTSPLRTPQLVMWMLFMMSVPFYVANSGVPQPGNVLIFIVAPLTLLRWNGRLSRDGRAAFVMLLAFTIWVFVVNYGWALVTDNWRISDYVIYPIYYAYNLLVFLIALVLYQRFADMFLKATLDALTIIVAFQVVASFFLSSSGNIRGSMFFNNPNQLGYYALLVACLMAVTQPRLKLGIVRTSATLLGCVFLAFISASRAAVGGIAILFVLMTFTNRKVLIASMVVVFATALFGGPIDRVFDATEQRLEYRKKEDVLETRGYDRLWRYNQYLLIGAGEGDFDRFADRPSETKEIHSSAATVLFSYGIVGATLFLMFVIRVVVGASLREIVLVVPVLIYTITHQGLRFTMLWVLLGVFLAIKPRRRTVHAPRFARTEFARVPGDL